MRVLIAGSSYRQHSPSSTGDLGPNHLEAACGKLGKVLAEQGHQIVLLSDAFEHVDRFVLAGYIDASQSGETPRPAVRVSYGTELDPENNGPANAQKFSEFRAASRVEFDDFNAEGDYPFNRVAIVRAVDVLIVIGGQNGVKGLSEIAYALDKPIIPIASFGGTAERIYDREKRYLQVVLKEDVDFLAKYFAAFSEKDAVDVVRLASCLVSAKTDLAEKKATAVDKVKSAVAAYVRSASFYRSAWYSLQIVGLVSGFLTTVLLLLGWNEIEDARKQIVTILPSFGGLASTIIIAFGIQQIWARREAAITEAKRLLAAAERLPLTDQGGFTKLWDDIENRLLDLEEKQRSGAIDDIVRSSRERVNQGVEGIKAPRNSSI